MLYLAQEGSQRTWTQGTRLAAPPEHAPTVAPRRIADLELGSRAEVSVLRLAVRSRSAFPSPRGVLYVGTCGSSVSLSSLQVPIDGCSLVLQRSAATKHGGRFANK